MDILAKGLKNLINGSWKY